MKLIVILELFQIVETSVRADFFSLPCVLIAILFRRSIDNQERIAFKMLASSRPRMKVYLCILMGILS